MMHQQQGAARAANLPAQCGTIPFDPAAWFAMWSVHGGVAMMIGDRLWVGRTQPIDEKATQTLNTTKARLHAPIALGRAMLDTN